MLWIVLHTLILRHLAQSENRVFIGLKFCFLLVGFSLNDLFIKRLEDSIRYGDFTVYYTYSYLKKYSLS